jgi:hypothetical protein
VILPLWGAFDYRAAGMRRSTRVEAGLELPAAVMP